MATLRRPRLAWYAPAHHLPRCCHSHSKPLLSAVQGAGAGSGSGAASARKQGQKRPANDEDKENKGAMPRKRVKVTHSQVLGQLDAQAAAFAASDAIMLSKLDAAAALEEKREARETKRDADQVAFQHQLLALFARSLPAAAPPAAHGAVAPGAQ